ncbi:hypothetical protein MNEG_12529 [Monoraphidium neglectum]|uniref:Uncharacterized protein n=1 Tax=Monoraphidium neglectum TaxID=145388 RepID=A0A0D2J6G0_9CHLO|nr:hypothetical protein MNEG_12529 [Monoraphidium neglectum]KIY95432.1 hypothetical protein MNEG_12529 [Monoraphidium neglectum]|eukprot:XP_013894452.1 hypothetical protein MNEG_12529 [Monoraphidium neglectum]
MKICVAPSAQCWIWPAMLRWQGTDVVHRHGSDSSSSDSGQEGAAYQTRGAVNDEVTPTTQDTTPEVIALRERLRAERAAEDPNAPSADCGTSGFDNPQTRGLGGTGAGAGISTGTGGGAGFDGTPMSGAVGAGTDYDRTRGTGVAGLGGDTGNIGGAGLGGDLGNTGGAGTGAGYGYDTQSAGMEGPGGARHPGMKERIAGKVEQVADRVKGAAGSTRENQEMRQQTAAGGNTYGSGDPYLGGQGGTGGAGLGSAMNNPDSAFPTDNGERIGRGGEDRNLQY